MRGARIAVLGGGAWGTALALASRRAGNDVSVWARDPAIVEALVNGDLARILPGSVQTGPFAASVDPKAALAGAQIVLAVVPAQALRAVIELVGPYLPVDAPLVICAKGIERETGQLPSAIVRETWPGGSCATLSGPSFAADVGRGLPTAVVVAAPDEPLAAGIASSLSSETFRCYSTGDQTGVEVGGALKNVLAIAAGAAIGAGLGASAQAALVTRGFVELRRIGAAFGGRPETMMGLSGLGDLLLTCGSAQSRNFAYGLALGRGEAVEGRPLAEGVATAGIAARIAAERGVEAPIIAATALILAGRLSIAEAVESLMTRPLKSEDP